MTKIPIPFTVLTSDKNSWLLRGFYYLFNKYIGEDSEAIIYGNLEPSFGYPKNFSFVSIGEYPKSRWGEFFMRVLAKDSNELILIMLEDYWCNSPADLAGLGIAYTYISENKDVLRFDLSYDRVNKPHREVGRFLGKKIIETTKNAPYLMSFQTGIWRKSLLLPYILDVETPQECEINGTDRLRKKYGDFSIVAFDRAVINYTPVYRGHRSELSLQKLSNEDVEKITSERWL